MTKKKSNLSRYARRKQMQDRNRKTVRTETTAGQERGGQSTPTLFINGKQYNGAVPFDQLQTIIGARLVSSEYWEQERRNEKIVVRLCSFSSINSVPTL